jgi:uncharacterized membrane protein
MANCGFLQFIHSYLGVSLAALWIPGPASWMYFAAAVLLAISLSIILKDEVPNVHGLDKILPFGRLFYAIPMAVFGTEHFCFPEEIGGLVPSWIPAHRFWVYLVGLALIAAALSIVVKRQAWLAATLLGIMLCLFVVLISAPAVVANPRDRFAWAVSLRDLAFSGGAFAFAGTQMKARPAVGVPGLVTLGRFFVGVPAVFFGVEHFLHPEFAPGVPLKMVTPAWIPVRLFWAYLAGAALLAAGSLVTANKKARLAATYLGVMILLLVLIVYLPILVSDPKSIAIGLNYFFDTLAFSGAILLLADALPKESDSHA